MTARDLKTKMREDLRLQVRELTKERQARASDQACAVLLNQRCWQRAQVVLFYAAIPGEVDLLTAAIRGISEGKIVALPRFEPGSGIYGVARVQDVEQIEPGRFGVREPSAAAPLVPLNQLDLILVPGLGFDENGGRLGRGGGYYDRLLSRASGTRCGVAFDEQIGQDIPLEPHDELMNHILTPTRWLDIKPSMNR